MIVDSATENIVEANPAAALLLINVLSALELARFARSNPVLCRYRSFCA